MKREEQFKYFGFIIEEPKTKCALTTNLKANLKLAESLQVHVNDMNTEPSQKNLFKAIENGLEFVEIVNNQWQKLSSWYDDFQNYKYILLYKPYTFKPYAIGRY